MSISPVIARPAAVLVAVAATVLLPATVARANTELDDGIAAPPIAVHATRDGTLAKLSVRFTNRVKGPDETELRADLPVGAAITAATAVVGGEAHPLALVRADTASAALEAIMAAAPGQLARRWGTVVSSSFGAMASFSIVAPHGAFVTLDLELTVPTCYADDARYALVPDAWAPAFDAALRARARTISAAARAACGDHPDDDDVQPRAMLALAAPELAAQPGGDARVGFAASAIALPTQQLARVELDLAGRLTTVPADLATALVVDASRSMSAAELDAQRAVVLAYARYAKATRLQVIAYDRHARAVLPAWTLANVAGPRIARELAGLALHNGSDVRAGLVAAATWLARAPGTHRVVLVTDERLPAALEALEAADLATLLPPDTLVHVVAIGAGSTLVRDDTAYLGLATRTGGITMRGGLDGDPAGWPSAEMLVRPTALERVSLTALGWTGDTVVGSCKNPDNTQDLGEALDEGKSCVWELHGPTGPLGPVALEGYLWGHRVSRVIQPDLRQARTLARTLQGEASSLSAPADRDALLDAAHAVNERWSLLATWGGPGGYSDLPGGGGTGFGSVCGCGHSSDIGIGSTGTATLRAPFSLEAQLRAGLHGCNVAPGRVDVTVETTLEEIVGLAVTVHPDATDTPEALAAKQHCVEEGLWNVPLALQDPPGHAVRELTL